MTDETNIDEPAQEPTIDEALQSRADAISKKLGGVKVHPLLFKENKDGTGDDIIGFIKEPSRMVKMAILDKSATGMVSAAGELLEIILIKDESDPRIYSEGSDNDKYFMGAAMAAFDTVKISSNTLKKK